MSRSPDFAFDPSQPHQLAAIEAVVELFDGQPTDAGSFARLLGERESADAVDPALFALDDGACEARELGATGNQLVVDRAAILANLQRIQDASGLEVQPTLVEDRIHVDRLAGGPTATGSEATEEEQFDVDLLGFDIEMETGTGKTYVYLRTIFELAKTYGFTKFVIFVPSVAIKEGVRTSIDQMRAHLAALYPGLPFDATVYDGKDPEQARAFATATGLQILVMTIASIRSKDRGAAKLNVYKSPDRLGGLRPIDYLAATQPIVIMDEPQNMESAASLASVAELRPTVLLRYSATHRRQRNVAYRLDAVDAHDRELVKQIVVASALQDGADVQPYVKLLATKKDGRGWGAELELAVRAADGTIARKKKRVKPREDLATVTKNPAYASGWWVEEIELDPPQIELAGHGFLGVGEAIGDHSDEIHREMLRETIREHLRKEQQLAGTGIKVLSLVFVDTVASYLGDGSSNDDADGRLVQWFDALLREEREKSTAWRALLPLDPAEYRKAYFAEMKTGSTEPREGTRAADEGIEVILRDKATLLDPDYPGRFVFSYAALREGWDNPNVFQICSLRDMDGTIDRRQTLGRGLRLPVRRTADGYVRVTDRAIAQLTVVAKESYGEFAANLQQEYEQQGVQIGRVRAQEFSTLALHEDDRQREGSEAFGFARSKELCDFLEAAGFIADGRPTAKFQPAQEGFTLGLSPFFAPYEAAIIEQLERATMARYVKPRSARRARTLDKELFASPEFAALWDRITARTTYRVSVDREQVVVKAIEQIKALPPIDALHIEITSAGITVQRGGLSASEKRSPRAADLPVYPLPDPIAELTAATSLTRATVVEILTGCGRLGEFIGNPADFLRLVRREIEHVLAEVVVEGIEYERIGGSVYELRELREDGLRERDRFIDRLYEVKHRQAADGTPRTDFDHVLVDSDPERRFAEYLDGRDDIAFFMKLPSRFAVPTPVGPYNPDWAIVKVQGGERRLLLVRETKSSDDPRKRRPDENAKIRAAAKHFGAIGIDDYAVATPGNWRT